MAIYLSGRIKNALFKHLLYCLFDKVLDESLTMLKFVFIGLIHSGVIPTILIFLVLNFLMSLSEIKFSGEEA